MAVSCTFLLSFFPLWLIFPFSFHIDILIYVSILNLVKVCVVAKIVMQVIIGDILCIVLLREITQNKTDRNIAFSVLLLFFFFGKSTWVRCLFLFFRLTIVFQGLYYI